MIANSLKDNNLNLKNIDQTKRHNQFFFVLTFATSKKSSSNSGDTQSCFEKRKISHTLKKIKKE